MKENVANWTFLRVSISMLMAFCFTSISLASEWRTIQENQGLHFSITKLQTEYTDRPLGIDVEHPRFSWQMSAPEGGHGYSQNAYRIVVTNEDGNEVWDSGRVDSNISVHIKYAGESLDPTTRYEWEVIVWDQDGNTASSSSWFETGFMNSDPDLTAWDGATWIGGTDEDLVFYSDYISVYKIRYNIQLDRESNSTRAGFIFGANEERLMKSSLNMMGINNERDEIYVEIELDISDVDGSEHGLAKLNIYRVGYSPSDSRDEPLESFDIPQNLINYENRYKKHQILAESNFGEITFYVNGDQAENIVSAPEDAEEQQGGFGGPITSVNLNPVGAGNNFISYPMVAEIGFRAEADQVAHFSDLEILNYRYPSNAMFSEELTDSPYDGIFENFADRSGSGFSIEDESYLVQGGNAGTKIIADPTRNSAPMLRTEFNTENKQIEIARLYATARGIYEMYLNGERVGDRYFTPGLTQYNRHHMYQSYDVTDMVNSNEDNALGAWLSEGWWSGNITYSGENWNFFGDRQSLLAKLVVTYTDGTKNVITTNPDDWSYFSEGPILYGSYFQGEVYDSRIESEVDGWSTPDYNEDGWTETVEIPLEGTAYMGPSTEFEGNTETFTYDSLRIIGQIGTSPRVVKTLTAKAVEEVRPNVFVYDMGQNMVGFPNITLSNTTPGDTLVMRYAEVRYPNLEEYTENVGMVMMENIRAALTQDRYIMKGAEEEVYQPRFTFHGYRYLEVTGVDKPIPLEDVKGLVVSSVDELASNYETSNDLVNRLWENITWSMRANFLSIPTDTPARNERMGWGGDINVFARGATYLADVNQFMDRHMLAIRDLQNEEGRFPDVAPVGGGFGGTLWGSAGIIVAWETYQQYGDLGLLEEHYDAMKDYVEYLNSRIDPETRILHEGPLGDWLSPEGFKNDNTLLWSAYHIRDIEILARTAELLGRPEDAATFWAQYEERKAHFNETYVDPETAKTIHSGEGSPSFGPGGAGSRAEAGEFVDTQASYAVPLAFDVFKEEYKAQAAENLATTVRRQNVDASDRVRPGYSLMTGFIGTASLNEALSKYRYDDMAYRLLQQTTYPSWLYPVVNGATTIWERLNSYTLEEGFGGNNSMNSFNHYSFGAVSAWMYNYSLGISRDPEAPAFKHIILRPTPDPNGIMKYARGYYDSMYGRIESGWHDQNGILHYNVTIPANTTATLHLPALSEEDVMENGTPASESEGVDFIGFENGEAFYKLISGSYEFTVPWQTLYEDVIRMNPFQLESQDD
ncbi:MAG: family 78 glycoside hydrolase catalytic domain [Balneolaceae bacterium]|nr:family 78 glycoside hydrolase catalytic domain [Balneolaceae bacterium]MDR9409239.1 family 78 glycoside hydrolase catalytic domain [Balneolaceae bacterium]